ARFADAARVRGRPVDAVQRARQDSRRRRLADAARAREDEGLCEALAAQRVAQRPRTRLLADDPVEGFRPPLARDDLVTHGRAAADWTAARSGLRHISGSA